MYNYGYEKKKYLEAKEKEENLLRLLGFPEWKIRYLRELDDFDFNNALFKELVDSPQKRTEKTEEVSMIFL